MGLADTTMKVMHHAMQGLTERGEVRAHNIANAETPGYQARDVPFEAELRRALRSGDLDRQIQRPVTLRNTLPDVHGNTVELENEMVALLEDQVRFDTVVSSYNAKVDIYRRAIGGR
jgi:flagellar basal-body rod protein FlgB